ncbi:PAP fimbrial minor pilin protein precursor [Serratia marcescens]|uniref:fimbrial protein n=1 Tax=Serratia TaxID=613 RepID=UPI000744F890|nr:MULTISPECIES: fimbrial protein [Serratia]MBN5253447.1 type 1 fimbrial protein [Serratia marcescens]CUZ93714.1 PAP fimbrial minor pilin protein precursor [Serratia marcescens]CVA50994.1 PAP fimbrial minor pilin protein precursor [Serratia marcescens]CVA55461.1 PAP fimbrial minor pilin protein precursor [Serratia marcescens]CVA63727.1 PAP fimbrial minor pilin protein precursor [Serratia marcescens]
MEFRVKGIKAICLLLLLICFAGKAISAVQGQGRVNMQGAIIDTACAIATESREQIIAMGITPVADIVRDGRGKEVPFSIELINCVLERADNNLPDWRQFQVTFDGHNDGGMFSVNGDVSGLAIRITDSTGNIARPGMPLPALDILPGNYRLNFSMMLVSNKQVLKAGSYFSSVRFKMDYY